MNDISKVNNEEDVVTPWEVNAEGTEGVDYVKLTSKFY